jgi:RHS repeat-associated protein
MVMPDGSTQPLTTLHVRATEYTIGANGPQAMPAELPPASGYTYAVELSVDEALAAGAKSVSFDKPVINYVEDFIGFPVGSAVPSGYYDRDRGQWIAAENGRVVKLLDVVNGSALLDTDGDGNADDDATLAALGVSVAERAQLARLYAPGQALWRVPVAHFSPSDYNWPWGPPDGAKAPSQTEPFNPDELEDQTCEQPGGSVIECQNQVLGERIAVTGTPFSLNYRSSRAPGRTAANTLKIPLSGATVPSSLQGIVLKIQVAGRLSQYSYPAQSNLSHLFVWDGKDSYGRRLQGAQPIQVDIGYSYRPQYYATRAAQAAAFGAMCLSPCSGVSSSRGSPIILWQRLIATLRPEDGRGLGLGGWSLNVQHRYDPQSGTLYLGDGSQRSARATGPVITTVAGGVGSPYNPPNPPLPPHDDIPATDEPILPVGVAVGPDGSLYIADDIQVRQIRRVWPNGRMTRLVVFDSQDGYGAFRGLAVGSDGSVYYSRRVGFYYSGEVFRIGPNGVATHIAGIYYGWPGGAYSGDGGPATQAAFGYIPSIAASPDGSLYLADTKNNCIRRIGPDGIVNTFAGFCTNPFYYPGSSRPGAGFSGDGGPANQAFLNVPDGVATGPDGSVYINDKYNQRIRRVGADGIINTVAGKGTICGHPDGDGGPATQACLEWPEAVAAGTDGSFYIVDNNKSVGWGRSIRRVGPDGIITTLAGSDFLGGYVFSGEGGPANQAPLSDMTNIATGTDGSLYVADFRAYRILRVASAYPGVGLSEYALPSEDSTEVYRFDAFGRHLQTLNALTGATRYRFGYDDYGRLQSITDGDGNVTAIEHDALGNPTAIVAPFGQRTALHVDANGYLDKLTDSAGGTYQMDYTALGLLTRFQDPNGKESGNGSTMHYDDQGLLVTDTDAAGGTQTLTRTRTDRNYQVTRTTALGRTTTYGVARLVQGDKQWQVTAPDGTTINSLIGLNGNTQSTQPDGTVQSQAEGPDPRFGMLAPITRAYTVKTGALTSALAMQRTVNLADKNNLLSVVKLTDTITLNGRTSTQVYDAVTQTFTSTSAMGRQSTARIDAQGRVLQAQTPGLVPVSFHYDSHGRPDQVTQDDGTQTRVLGFGYGNDGYLASVTDPLDRTEGYAYDAAGRLTIQTLADGRQIRYAYDANGNLTSIKPPGRTAHEFRYTPVDQMEQYIPPDVSAGTNKTVYSFNKDRQLTTVQRPDGQQLQFNYDPTKGRLNTLTTPDGDTAYGYDAATGKLSSIMVPGGEKLAYAYNGALLAETAWTGDIAGNVGYGYDNDFRVTTVSLNGANSIAYQYDNDGLLTQAGGLTLNRNAQNGLLTGSTLGSVSDSLSYDGFGEVRDYTAKYSGNALFSTQYTYDPLGRITRKVETVQGETDTYDYSYDLAGRLERVKLNGVTISVYSYDANGNRLSYTAGGATVNGSYDGQDRLLTYGGNAYTYTANGELKTKTAGGQETVYRYDVLGNLKQVKLSDGKQIDYLIDAGNRRIGKKVDGVLKQGFLYQDQLKPIAELDSSGSVVSRFVYATHANVPNYMVKGGITYRLITDHLGSPRLVVNIANSAIAQQMDYDEFGNVVLDTTPGFQPFGFAGGLYDRDTGLVRFGARDYDAETGRWMAKDPILFAAGMNVYRYANGDPVNLIDPTGKDLSLIQDLAFWDIRRAVTNDDEFVRRTDSILSDFILLQSLGWVGGVRNFGYTVCNSLFRNKLCNPETDKYYQDHVCTGISTRAREIISHTNIQGVTAVEEISRHQKEGELAHTAVIVSFEDGSALILDWHATLNSGFPKISTPSDWLSQ